MSVIVGADSPPDSPAVIRACDPSATVVSSSVSMVFLPIRPGASDAGLTVMVRVSDPAERLGSPIGKPLETLAVIVGASPL